MTTLHEAAQMALDALDDVTPYFPGDDKRLDKACTALREALAAKQEPVGFISPEQRGRIADPPDESGVYLPMRKTSRGLFTLALYAAPPAAPASQWMPIETAPEDMTTLVVVRWIQDGEDRHEFDYREDGCWIGWHEHAEYVETIGGHGVSYTPPYTHWMPLPDAPGAAPAPDDWVTVPREPTREMVRAIGNVIPQGPYDFAAMAVYRAMVAAAPAQPADATWPTPADIERAKAAAKEMAVLFDAPAQPVPQPTTRTADCLMCGHCAATGERVAKPAAPLTDEQIERLRENTFSTNNPFCPVDSKSMRKAVRAAERAQGITGGGNG